VPIHLRSSPTINRRGHRAHRRMLLLVRATTLALAPVVLATSPAYAGSTATNTATLPIAVRSLAVTPATAAFGNCTISTGGGTVTATTGLVIPGGSCSIGTVTGPTTKNGILITNGGVPGHIDVSGGPAVPIDGGSNWALGSSAASNTYVEKTEDDISGLVVTSAVATTPTCDGAFAARGSTPSCSAAAGQTGVEALLVEAPSSSTDSSSSFTITTTWTAVP
jgi:hypothetical protein